MARSKIDTALLFATRILRLFAYGFLSVVLTLYLAHVGLSEQAIGLLFTLTLAGDAGISLWITTSADRIGRRRMLALGAVLMIVAGAAFVLTNNPILLTLAAIIGVISPSGNEIGPFLSIEQAALSQLLPNERRTQAFAWYNLVGSFATALGALSGGWLAQALQTSGFSPLESYRIVLNGYAMIGALLAAIFLCLSSSVETPRGHSPARRTLGLHDSRGVVLKLSALFALDAFAGGFIVQSLIAYWFHLRFGVDVGAIGSIFFGANILAGISALLAVRIAARIGLIRTSERRR
ncbi:MAG: MFS transporter [Chloroflexi bacterium]|nr:MFS transporter [Chloroflexota bacterium]